MFSLPQNYIFAKYKLGENSAHYGPFLQTVFFYKIVKRQNAKQIKVSRGHSMHSSKLCVLHPDYSNRGNFASAQQLMYSVCFCLLLHILDAGILHLQDAVTNTQVFSTLERAVLTATHPEAAHMHLLTNGAIRAEADVKVAR